MPRSRLRDVVNDVLAADKIEAYIFELRVERLLPIPDEYRPQFHTPRQMAQFMRPLETRNQEEFYVLLLDTKHKLRGIHMTGRGSVDASVVHPADVYRPCLLTGSNVYATAHNHPSGDPQPSSNDLAIYARLKEGDEILGFQAIDHLVIGGEGRYWSAREQGRL